MKEKIRSSKLKLLEMHQTANSGHIGGNFSCIDVLMILHHLVMTSEDRFILSKGHSAGALYVTLWSLGKLSDSDLQTFCQENTLLPGHPSGGGIPNLLFSTGSLGHGPSLAAGLAIAARYQHSNRHVYCVCSDGEWQEGSCWEALTFAVHQQLSNLTIIIDQNGLQGFGSTKDIISCHDLTDRITAFGAHVQTLDGHDINEIKMALDSKMTDRPSVLILNTVKGKGLHFENTMASHYLPLTKEQYVDACLKLNQEA